MLKLPFKCYSALMQGLFHFERFLLILGSQTRPSRHCCSTVFSIAILCSHEDEFVNPFIQSQHSEGWQRHEELAPDSSREAFSNPSIALSSMSHMPVDSFASAVRHFLPDSYHQDTLMPIERSTAQVSDLPQASL